jgi:adenine/guanine phosphoribosyltransferase-like PRPP-binding protein
MVAVTDFRTVAELARVISHNLWRLPGDFSTVAAIPESGRLPAALLGLQTGRPVRDLAEMTAPGAAPPEGAVLLVDDVCLTGTTMAAARDRLAERHPGVTVHRLAVYCRGGSEAAVDLSFERSPADPVFEWSLFRAPVVGRAMFDLDGILCGDCPTEDDDDGERYRRFLQTATPQAVPRGPVHSIVTARLEAYRPETEAWLARHGIDYGRLVMLDLPSDAERRRTRPQGRFKAAAYAADAGAVLFVESESWQAREIARGAPGKAVFDYQARLMLDGAALEARSLPRRLRRRMAGLGRRVARLAGA